MPKPFTFVDLCCGIGGLSLGFKLAGFELAAAVDIDPRKAAWFDRLLGPGKVLVADIASLSAESLLHSVEGRYPDVVIGAPPLPTATRIGRLMKQTSSMSRNLMFDFLRLAVELRPQVILLDTVPTFVRTKPFQDDRQAITSLLEGNGYGVQWTTLNAADFGVPQKREHGYMLAVRSDSIVLPHPPVAGRKLTIAEALDDILEAMPESPMPERLRADLLPASGALLVRGINDRNEAPRWAPFDELSFQITAMAAGQHRVRDYDGRWRRLTAQGVSRLQGFPDSFRPGNAEWLGAATPPPLAKAVAEAVLASLSQKTLCADALAPAIQEPEQVRTPLLPTATPADAGPRPRTLAEILAAFDADPDLVYDPTDLINLHHALNALPHKHFVILHGVSGTGKSQFAQAYANALYGRPLRSTGNPYYQIVAVQPTWQDRTALLGYYNPLTECYEVPDFLAHVLKAKADPDHPYIICLDEMNLAVVEHYFADFLSAWESREEVVLHRHPDKVHAVDGRLPIPPNLAVIGTVNIDETTHGFSPKVLDRAYTVELTHVDVAAYAAKLRRRPEAQPHLPMLDRAMDLLAAVHTELVPYGLHFAYRTLEEIAQFLLASAGSSHPLPEMTALDLMLAQKVLPRLRGDDRLLGMLEALEEMTAAFLGAHPGGGQYRTPAALARMAQDARRYGTFQYWR